MGAPLRAMIVGIGLLAACGGGDDAASPESDGGTDATLADGDAAGTSSDGDVDGGARDGATFDAGPVAEIHWLGRFDLTNPSAARFAWPGSTVMARFRGTGVAVTLSDTGASDTCDAVVDDGAPLVITAAGASPTTTSIATGLVDGEHTVFVRKRTESFVGTATFRGFTVTGGALVASPAPYARKIEIVGDSITCGYGVLGASATCSFTPATESESIAYGALAASALSAEHRAIAYSGQGIYRSYEGSTVDPMPVRWHRTFADDASSTWNLASWIPDVVVVNLGTNDFAKGDPGTAFVTAYDAFVKDLRASYPVAAIVVAVSPMLSGTSRTQQTAYLQQVVSQATGRGDTKVTMLDFAMQSAADGYGCDYHPSATTQAKMAATLEAHLKTVLGWN